MGKVNGLWQDRLEQIGGNLDAGILDRAGAIQELMALGFDWFEAGDWADEVKQQGAER